MSKFLKLSAAALSMLAAANGAEGASTRRMPLNLPMASLEPMSAATIVSEGRLQLYARLQCNSNYTTCFKSLAPVPAGERWEIKFVSCATDAAIGATFRHFALQVSDAAVTKLVALHYIAPQHQDEGQVQTYTASQPMVLTVNAGEIIHVLANSIGGMGGGSCGLTGVRQKLG